MRRLHQHAFRITAQEALPWLPKITYQDMLIELDGKAERCYDQLETDFVTYLKSENIQTTTPLAVTRMIRLQQLTGGWLVGDEGDEVRVGNHKLAALQEFMEDWDDRVVIFCRFRNEIEDIAQLFKKQKRSFMTYHGDTKNRSCWEDFQKKSGPQGFIAQISTGGVGIDLFASRLVIFYSRTF